MRPNAEFSIFDILLESLGTILRPGVEAIQLQRELNIRTIEEIPSAVQRGAMNFRPLISRRKSAVRLR
jgi:hypothetical protein